jgi:phosphopentomutase
VRRVFLIVLDSLGVGALPDAARFGDAGTHTLDHLARAAGLSVPRLAAWGLGNVEGVRAIPPAPRPVAAFGRCAERSPGKDTTTGHWEMMGVVLEREFPVFPAGFPAEFLDELARRADLPGFLHNRPASGTEIIARLGAEHVASKKPIAYTSADSVFQVAAHELHFGLERLYGVCAVARELLDPLGVARVIARPFVGEPGGYERTYNRRDFSLEPPGETVLDRLRAAGIETIGVGKIGDIFAQRGISRSIHTEGNQNGMGVVRELAAGGAEGLVFCNLVDFDMLYGHRRDARGYARALEAFDAQLGRLERELRPGDLVLLTADHGNDPTFTATTDHTREYVPLLAGGPGLAAVPLGTRASLADVGATVEEALTGRALGPGVSFLGALAAA